LAFQLSYNINCFIRALAAINNAANSRMFYVFKLLSADKQIIMKIRDSGMPPEEMWITFFDTEFILSELGIDKNIKDAAEFGSGYGTFSIPAAKIITGILYAIDVEPGMIKSLRNKTAERNISNIKVIETDFVTQGTGLNDNSIDYVMLFNILHSEEPVKLLNEAKRILRQNGKAGIIHWNYDPSTPRGPSMEIRPRPEQCKNWIEQAGFKIDKYPFPIPPYHYGIVGIKKNLKNEKNNKGKQ